MARSSGQQVTAPKSSQEHWILVLSSMLSLALTRLFNLSMWTACAWHFTLVEVRGQFTESLLSLYHVGPRGHLRLLGLKASTFAHQATSAPHFLLFMQFGILP